MQKNRVMLVADDIDVNRASFRAMFEEEYEVLEAGDGNETLKILEERKVDIVILDMCMPVKSGKQELKQILMRMEAVLKRMRQLRLRPLKR